LLSHKMSTSEFFLLTKPAPTEIYPLSLHDALPISAQEHADDDQVDEAGDPRRGDLRHRVVDGEHALDPGRDRRGGDEAQRAEGEDRKSTRLNSSHLVISYAVFCLKKKLAEAFHLAVGRNILRREFRGVRRTSDIPPGLFQIFRVAPLRPRVCCAVFFPAQSLVLAA